MNKIEKIRAEIKRLNKELPSVYAPDADDEIAAFRSGRRVSYMEILSFIDSLQDEPEMIETSAHCGPSVTADENGVRIDDAGDFSGMTEANAKDADALIRLTTRGWTCIAPQALEPKKGYDPDYLQSCIDRARESWKGVDVDKFLDEIRGIEPESKVVDFDHFEEELEKALEREIVRYTVPFHNNEENLDERTLDKIARHFAKWGAEHIKE